jgi:hypothetical protein
MTWIETPKVKNNVDLSLEESKVNIGRVLGEEPNPSINQTAKQLRCLVPSALRAPVAGYFRR